MPKKKFGDTENEEQILKSILDTRKDATINEVDFLDCMGTLHTKLVYIKDVYERTEQVFEGENITMTGVQGSVSMLQRLKYLNDNFLKKSEECKALHAALALSRVTSEKSAQTISNQAHIINGLSKELLMRDGQLRYLQEESQKTNSTSKKTNSVIRKPPTRRKRFAKATVAAEAPQNLEKRRRIAQVVQSVVQETPGSGRRNPQRSVRPTSKLHQELQSTSRKNSAINKRGQKSKNAPAKKRNNLKSGVDESTVVSNHSSSPPLAVDHVISVKQEPPELEESEPDHFSYACNKVKIEPRENFEALFSDTRSTPTPAPSLSVDEWRSSSVSTNGDREGGVESGPSAEISDQLPSTSTAQHDFGLPNLLNQNSENDELPVLRDEDDQNVDDMLLMMKTELVGYDE